MWPIQLPVACILKKSPLHEILYWYGKEIYLSSMVKAIATQPKEMFYALNVLWTLFEIKKKFM